MAEEPNSEQVVEQPRKRIAEMIGAEIQKQQDEKRLDAALQVGSENPMSQRISSKITRLQHGYTE
jgi:hypothetical protein